MSLTDSRVATDPLVKYHYTVGLRWPLIERAGFIERATVGLLPKERGLVWCSTHPDWEETANKGALLPGGEYRRLTRAETHHAGQGLFRIAVRDAAAPLSWATYKAMKRTTPSWVVLGLERAAKEVGADPAHWWVSVDRIYRRDWLFTDFYYAGAWRRLETYTTNQGA